MPAWLPTSALRDGYLHEFAAGTLVVSEPGPAETGLVLAVRVQTLGGPALYHLTTGAGLRTGHVSGLNLEDPAIGFGIEVPEVEIELEWDLDGSTIEPGLSLAGLGLLALGTGGVRLVGAAPTARAAHYFDPADWTQSPFSDRHDGRVLTPRWRLVLPLSEHRRIVLFDAAAARTGH